MLRKIVADALYFRGVALLQENRNGRARAHLGFARRLQPRNPDYAYAAALAAERSGARDEAVRFCERALDLDPEHARAHDLLTGMFLHGEQYFDVLRRIHEHLRPRTYVEIGVETGASMTLLAPGTRALGVDPQPAIRYPLPPEVRIFAEPSDDFFARHDVHAELGGLPVDLAFIDGMHHFEYALRDFVNLERLCTREGTILIHDCFPHDRLTAERERKTAFWSGDVWRLILLLKKYRPDLWIATIATPPTGLGIVRNLDPDSRVLSGKLEFLYREFLALDYRHLERDRGGRLNLMPNDWAQIQAFLDRPVRR